MDGYLVAQIRHFIRQRQLRHEDGHGPSITDGRPQADAHAKRHRKQHHENLDTLAQRQQRLSAVPTMQQLVHDRWSLIGD